MTPLDRNPFQELYVTDSADPLVFVNLFSDFLVKTETAMFRPGHVILKGTQGSGKSMLLNLLRPEIRLAYSQAQAEFPIPEPHRKFIGAGINLTRSGALDIGQRPLKLESKDADMSLFPLFFADFINSFLVRDLLRSIEIMAGSGECFSNVIAEPNMDAFATMLAKADCWFGYFEHCDTFASLTEVLDKRIASYRKFHQYNVTDLDPAIAESKTSIGEPIARAADCMKKSGLIGSDVAVYIRIDQIERLYRSDVLRPELGRQYRRIVNKAIGSRDSRVSYRVGTRRYAWEDDLTMYGTEDKLEHIRDYRIIDLDAALRRTEDVKTWIFPSFARDAFRRRLLFAGFDGTGAKDPIGDVFGNTPGPEHIAAMYSGNDASRSLRLDDEFSDSHGSAF